MELHLKRLLKYGTYAAAVVAGSVLSYFGFYQQPDGSSVTHHVPLTNVVFADAPGTDDGSTGPTDSDGDEGDNDGGDDSGDGDG